MFRLRAPHLFHWLALLLALTVFARALVPVGFMPTAQADGTVHLVICTSDGAKTIDLPAPAQAPAKNTSGACLFAPQGTAQDTPVSAQAFYTPTHYTPVIYALTQHEHAPLSAPNHTSARAPPAVI